MNIKGSTGMSQTKAGWSKWIFLIAPPLLSKLHWPCSGIQYIPLLHSLAIQQHEGLSSGGMAGSKAQHSAQRACQRTTGREDISDVLVKEAGRWDGRTTKALIATINLQLVKEQQVPPFRGRARI